ncbi:MAG: hypothetical protein IPH33_13500 [Bacteroidetes bacterium]|nr:hypothetical protein [Bacteroidota bacterium]
MSPTWLPRRTDRVTGQFTNFFHLTVSFLPISHRSPHGSKDSGPAGLSGYVEVSR